MLWFVLPLALTGLFAAAGLIIFMRYEVSFSVVLALLLPAGLVEVAVFFLAPANLGAQPVGEFEKIIDAELKKGG